MCGEVICWSYRRTQRHFLVEMEGGARQRWRWERLSFHCGVTASLILFVQLIDHLGRKRDRYRDHNCALALLNGLGQFMVNERFTFNTHQLMDAPREVRIAAHSGASIRTISKVVEDAWIPLRQGVGIEDSCDIPFKGIRLAIDPAQVMFVAAILD